MAYLPVCLNLAGKRVLIVGGGRVASKKLRTLLQYTTEVAVVAPQIAAEIREAGITIYEREYKPSDLDGVFLVYACTNHRDVNQQLLKEAAARGILINVTDSPRDSDFISPAIVRRGDVSVAVSSNATDVRSALALRDRIAALIGDEEVLGTKPGS